MKINCVSIIYNLFSVIFSVICSILSAINGFVSKGMLIRVTFLGKSVSENKVIGQGGFNVSSHKFYIFRGYFKLVILNIVSFILNKIRLACSLLLSL